MPFSVPEHGQSTPDVMVGTPTNQNEGTQEFQWEFYIQSANLNEYVSMLNKKILDTYDLSEEIRPSFDKMFEKLHEYFPHAMPPPSEVTSEMLLLEFVKKYSFQDLYMLALKLNSERFAVEIMLTLQQTMPT